ncbi:gliding motility-associated C-terminal domain-containing protein [Chitinophaga sp. CF118]|uniref:gliding motility-associated C-terminal domain-containing protein n=1 Tax=Chitinophaga sp. CF118 TaxID=1884367 RepID=UPI0008EBD200|nr:gliding motility-associated C-terminal domain-containing protein [Chitinophaga sp. CF118]SFE41240.1 gliding motility-associated C-terminal domain-containing protein [Chitinophaga sp. CF118]
MKRIFLVTLMLVICTYSLYAQTYLPVTVAGYNNDVIAETGTDATAVTSTGLDLQEKILYSLAFATTNSLALGLADNGTIVNGTRTYQLGDYTLNNALYLSKNAAATNTVASGNLDLVTPAAFTKISLLAFSTEQTSTLNITLNFTDGTTLPINGVVISDWFNGPNAIISAVGRVQRIAAPPYTVEDIAGNNPRFYAVDISIPCEDQSKQLAFITFDYITGGGNASRAVILSLSGVSNIPMNVTSSITPAACGKANGSAQLSISGGNGLLSYEWNTVPVQLTPLATGLPAGTYTCTVTDGNICATLIQLDVTQQSTVKVKAIARPNTICAGSATTLSAVPAGGKIVHYTWQPGNVPDSTTRVSPADTTTYIVTAEDAFGCAATDTIKIMVIPKPAPPVVTPQSICPDSSATLIVQDSTNTFTYNWYPYPSGGDLAGTGASFTTPPVTETTTWYVEAVNGACSGDRAPVTVSSNGHLASPVVVVTETTTTSATFKWKPVPGATGYLVAIDDGPYKEQDTASYKITGLMQESVNIHVIALGAITCENSGIGSANAKLKPGDVFVPNAFTPNGDGKNDIFKPEGNIKAINMKIFNQWGELISETTTVGTGWNGTSGSKVQPMGVYMYAIKIILNNGTEVIKKGSVNLLR